MKLPSFKWIILIAIILSLCYVNNRYEIFAVNIPKGQGIKKSEGSFRVMTWNINAFLGMKEAEDVRTGLVSEIEKLNPDILCLQELSPKIFKEIQNSLDSVFGYTDSMAIKKEPYRYWIYSKKPIRNFKRYKCILKIDTTGFNQLLQNEITIIQRQLPISSVEVEATPGKWITIFAVHLRSSAYSTARRSMEEGSSWKDGIPLYLENYKIGAKIRNFEADNLCLYIDSLETNQKPIIIAGDFNDWSGSYCMNTIRDDQYKDAWWEGGLGFGITYDEWHLKLRLDHILYNSHFVLQNVIIDNNPFSDHFPLIADFVI